jgi:type I restriction enzyme, R subunit
VECSFTNSNVRIVRYWDERIAKLEADIASAADEQEEVYRRRQIEWMRERRVAVVVSEDQGEVEKFRQWGPDITPHPRLMKQGIELPESMR